MTIVSVDMFHRKILAFQIEGESLDWIDRNDNHPEFSMSSVSVTATNSPAAAGLRDDSTVRKVAELAGRVFLAAIFLASGLGKIGGYAGTAAYMSSVGVPGALLPLVIATEVLGAAAIVIGWKTRIAGFLLAGFTLLAGLIFHSNFADQIQMIMFLKNVSIAGGLLLLVANGAGALSLDRRGSR